MIVCTWLGVDSVQGPQGLKIHAGVRDQYSPVLVARQGLVHMASDKSHDTLHLG
jgi:hypothetical protein